MIRKFADGFLCAWCGWLAHSGRQMKNGRAVCTTCIREETQD